MREVLHLLVRCVLVLCTLVSLFATLVQPLPAPQGSGGQSTQTSTSVVTGTSLLEWEATAEEAAFIPTTCDPLWGGYQYALINVQTNEPFAPCTGCIASINDSVVQQSASSDNSTHFTVERAGDFVRFLTSDGGYLSINENNPAGNEGGHYAQITYELTMDGQCDWDVVWYASVNGCYLMLKNRKDYLLLSVCEQPDCQSVPNAQGSSVMDQPLAVLTTYMSNLTLFQYELIGTPPISEVTQSLSATTTAASVDNCACIQNGTQVSFTHTATEKTFAPCGNCVPGIFSSPVFRASTIFNKVHTLVANGTNFHLLANNGMLLTLDTSMSVGSGYYLTYTTYEFGRSDWTLSKSSNASGCFVTLMNNMDYNYASYCESDVCPSVIASFSPMEEEQPLATTLLSADDSTFLATCQ